MKKHCLILVFILCAAPLFAQVSGLSIDKSAYRENYQNNGQVFTMVEQMPEFPGGQDALFQYIKQNLHYPPTLKEEGIQGRAICAFVVNTDGSICCAEIAKSTGNALLDREAVLLIKGMPAWTPGTQNGKLVRVKYTIPIVFKSNKPQTANQKVQVFPKTCTFFCICRKFIVPLHAVCVQKQRN